MTERVLERLTVSAAVRFIPRPPALVLRRNTKISVLQAEERERGGGRVRKREKTILHSDIPYTLRTKWKADGSERRSCRPEPHREVDLEGTSQTER